MFWCLPRNLSGKRLIDICNIELVLCHGDKRWLNLFVLKGFPIDTTEKLMIFDFLNSSGA